MIPTALLVILCLGMVAIVSMVQTKAEKKASAKKAAATRARNKTGLEFAGIYHDHLKAGKAVMVTGMVTTPFIKAFDFGGAGLLSPADFVIPPDIAKTAVEGIGFSQRVEGFLRGCAVNLTSRGATGFASPVANAGTSGKIILTGGAIHIIGSAKQIKKLTKGLPIKPA